MQQVVVKDLGLIPYQTAWDYQKDLHQQVVATKLNNRHLTPDDENYQPPIHYLILCEHPPTYTLGKSGDMSNLLLSSTELTQQGFQFFKINRGGDITYHGPGQLVVYPIFDLDLFFTDVHRYVRYLEEVVIRTLAEYGLTATRQPSYTGVWLPANTTAPNRKLCAIGIHLSRWVTMHGLAFNMNTDLTHFNYIIPCGIQDEDKTVSSLAQELNRPVPIEEIKTKIKQHFATLFQYDYLEIP